MPQPIIQHRFKITSTPDICDNCPLLGFIPPEQCKYQSKYIRICLHSYERISNRGAKVKRGNYCPFSFGKLKSGDIFSVPERVAEVFGLYKPAQQQKLF